MDASSRKPGSRILSVSSHVVRGAVGNRAAQFALERLGHEVWSLPTTILAHHPGQGLVNPFVTDPASFRAIVNDIRASADLSKVDGILTGYFADPDQVAVVADLIEEIREARPRCLFLCDPVLGDRTAAGEGALYVGKIIAEAIRDRLLPLADIATPNLFECTWLAGKVDELGADLTVIAGDLGPETVIVTSHGALMRDHIGNLMVTGDDVVLAEHRRIETAAKGSGDVFAALFLARRLERQKPERALELATSSVFEIMAAAGKWNEEDLPVARAQHSLLAPNALVNMRRLKSKAPG